MSFYTALHNIKTVNNYSEKNITEGGQSLCLSCGLCCTDYFHPKANIQNENDKIIVLKFGGKVMNHNNKQYFRLPCPAFEENCTIYKDRPSSCRKHQCDLLKSVLNNRIGLNQAKLITKNTKAIASELSHMLDNMSESIKTKEFQSRIRYFFEQYEQNKDTPEFKHKHAHLLMKFATFIFLKDKYFYKPKEIIK